MDSKLEAGQYQGGRSGDSRDSSTLSDDFPTVDEVLSSPVVQPPPIRRTTVIVEDDSDESIISPLARSKRLGRADQIGIVKKRVTRYTPESDSDNTNQDFPPKKTRRISKASFGGTEYSDNGDASNSSKGGPMMRVAARTLRTPRKQIIPSTDDDDDLIIADRLSTPSRESEGSSESKAEATDTSNQKRKFSLQFRKSVEYFNQS